MTSSTYTRSTTTPIWTSPRLSGREWWSWGTGSSPTNTAKPRLEVSAEEFWPMRLQLIFSRQLRQRGRRRYGWEVDVCLKEKAPTIWFYKSIFSRLLAVILNWSKNARWQKDSYNFPDNVFKSIFLSIFQNLKPDEPVFIRYLSVTKWFMRQFMVGFAAGLYVGYCRCWRRRFSRAVQRTIILIGLNMWSDFATALICGNRCWTLREGAERVKWNLKVGHI